jgi:hypothetical protein
VCSRNLENEEAKSRYWAVENATTMGCNARKTNKQTSYFGRRVEDKQQCAACCLRNTGINNP